MKLFIVHAGYYDNEIGIYELHTNFFVVAEDVKNAKQKIKDKPLFKAKRMHIDAIQEIDSIDGYKVSLQKDPNAAEHLTSYTYSQAKLL